MFRLIFLVVFGCFLNSSAALWSCSSNADCSTLAGSVCTAGTCACIVGQQAVLGGTLCADFAPYYTSTCYEDFQCNRLLTSFECRKEEGSLTGSCQCQPGYHFFLTRCWQTRDFGETCDRDEQCLSLALDPYSMRCDGACVCADGYYTRQRGECRKIASAVGDRCVIDEDCQFEGGVCDRVSFSCTLASQLGNSHLKFLEELQSNNTVNKMAAASKMVATPKMAAASNMATRQHGEACSVTNACVSPFECNLYGFCICPLGYYPDAVGTQCLAELGSPATSADQCTGLLAEVRDGICTCPANFFFDDNMRDCVKVTRVITESCTFDNNCYTFGTTSRCGEPQGLWGMRVCECIHQLSVWDSQREMCRLFAGIGESCQVDSDCLAGELEIQCQLNSQGEGVCTCPEGFIENDGLCLSTGLSLGDTCQASLECTEVENTECIDRVCACSNGYQEEDGNCAPTLGGNCANDVDCVIMDSICSPDTSTCQCSPQFVEFEDSCWPSVEGLNSTCEVTAQCQRSLGSDSVCLNGICVCDASTHYRDEWCWPLTGLFETCARTSECFLAEDMSDRTVCRNGMCQCEFEYPYSEEKGTCVSSATRKFTSVFTMIAAVASLSLIM